MKLPPPPNSENWSVLRSWFNNIYAILTNVENTALSTWAGSINITTLGTITTGTWHGTPIADSYVFSAGTWNTHVSKTNLDAHGSTATSPITVPRLNLSAKIIAPTVDGTTAIQYTKADGTTVILTIDTTNAAIGINTATPKGRFDVAGAARFSPQTGAFNTGTSIYTSLVLDGGANGALYAIGRADPANVPFVALNGWDSGTQRILYYGGGDWDVTDATQHQFWCAQTYNETLNTAVLTATINYNNWTFSVPIIASPGSAAAPSRCYSGSGGSTMGEFKVSSGILGWSAGGTERMRLSTTALTPSVPIIFPGYTVAALGGLTPVANMRVIVTDLLVAPAFLAPIGVGGGVVRCPAFYDGNLAAWLAG